MDLLPGGTIEMLPVLRRGAHGSDVELLQKRLHAGFSPGRIDGRFGPGTEAALLAFSAPPSCSRTVPSAR